MNASKNKLYIFGNGFDRAHALATGYNDFRSWLKANKHDSFIERFERLYPNVKILNAKGEIEWGDLEKALGLTTAEDMIEFDQSYTDCGCVDKNMAQGSNIIAVTTTLQNLLDSWARSIDVSCAKSFLEIDSDCMFLTFNYTTVLEDNYKVPKENVLHIHNSVTNPGNMIIGYYDPTVGGKYIYPIETGENAQRIRIAKVEHRRYIKYTSSCIRKNKHFFESLKDIQEIHVFGHSLEIVDLPYIKEISQNVRMETVWNIYIYNLAKDPLKETIINTRIRPFIKDEQAIKYLDTSEFPNHVQPCN